MTGGGGAAAAPGEGEGRIGRSSRVRWLVLAILLVPLGWGVPLPWRTPSDARDWAEDQARLPQVVVEGDEVRIAGLRDFRHAPDGTVRQGYRDDVFSADQAVGVWFVLAPFATRYRALAHSFLSFEFTGPRFVAVSVEARREVGETYSLLGGLGREFELAYVMGTEEDLLGLRAVRGDTLFLYPSVATPEQAWALFLDMAGRARALRAEPEFYNTFFNNCTTNLRDHVNRLTPGRLPWGWGVLLPGFSDALALERGLLDTHLPLEAARVRFRVDQRARAVLADGGRDFGLRIRQEG